MSTPQTKLGKALEIVLWIAALAVLAENIKLSRENRRLREAAAPQIAAGMQLQMLSGLSLDGRVEPISLPLTDAKVVIITFSPRCPACQANQEGWMNLASILKAKGVRVLWISRDPIDLTRDYCLKHGIPLIDVVADPPYRTYLQLGLARVPNTVLVSGSTVEKVWAGRMDSGGWNLIFAHFGERHEAAPATRSTVGAVCTEVAAISVSLDGVEISNPTSYFTGASGSQSPAFNVQMPSGVDEDGPGNLLESLGYKVKQVREWFLTPSAEQGYYLFLNPLPPGPHKLQWTASGCTANSTQDITYNLTVLGQ